MDLLKDIFELQEGLNNDIFAKQCIVHTGTFLTMNRIRADVTAGNLGPNDLPNVWIGKYLWALQKEAGELDAEVLKKWWSKDKIDIQNIRVEIIDMMHFLTSMAIAAGLTAEEFHRLYTAKHRVNQNRQENGYSMATKDEADNKGIV